jgi:hypothetical protein
MVNDGMLDIILGGKEGWKEGKQANLAPVFLPFLSFLPFLPEWQKSG